MHMTTGRINQIPCPWRAPQGPARSAGVPRCPSAPEEQKFGFKEFTPIGANERPVTATPPAHRRHTCDHPIAPTGTPQDPVRTQGCSRRDHPKGGDRPAAYGPRVGGPDPADTPTNGGYRRAAPPGICFSMMASGQRSTDPNGAGDQTATGLRSPQTAPPRRFTASAGISAAGVGGRPRFLTRGPTSGYLWRRGTARRPAWQGSLPPTSLGGREFGQTFACPKSILGGPVLYGVVRALGRFPIQSGPPTFAHLAADMGGPPFGKGRMANWRPHRPAVFAGSSACCDAGATANWPTGRSVEHRKRRPTVSPSAKANGRLAGVYLRDLAPDARRRNPQVPAPNAGPPPAAAPIRQLLHPTGIPAGWPSAPAVPPTPLGGRDAVQTFPCPESILGGTVLPYKVGQSRVPPIADNWWAAAVAGRASRPRSPCSPKSDRRLVAPEEPRAVAHRRPCRVGNWRPHRASTAQSGHRDPLRVAHASKATGDPPGPVERAVAHPVAVAMSDGPTGVSCPRSPSKRPALPDPLVGGVVHKSSQGRADAQRLVATRLLDRLHDPLGHFSPSSPGLLPGSRRQPAEVRGPEAYSYPTTTCGATSPRSGTDSDLEAFSHYPADGSVAALPGQTAAKTNYLNQRFLSY
ncbi:hypothetical protein OAory_01114530 [Aspergillus oryzae]|uniref:Uncharacterized protein n=1 Tax=Aspergillus oryzae TaxID=5062 RepID=A0A1S9D459_ASPOZ|nr:hypothetical protein OAory_01114530 [Aspergillus oryzae]